MEKKISYQQFQSVKSVAKAIDPIMRKFEPIRKKMEALEEEAKNYQAMINALEQGVVKITGFHVADLVKKVVEVTGTTADGKPIKSVKFLPTDICKYDEKSKQYIVTVAEEKPVAPAEEEVTQVPAPSESVYGNDFDEDKEKVEAETVDPFNASLFE